MKKLIYIKRRSAFTMLELIFVIVVIGILAAVSIPRLDRDIRQEAADNILSAIRYTKVLALMDSKVSTDDDWQKKLWSIRFTIGSNPFYIIGTDDDSNAALSKSETAIDPSNGKYFYNSSGIFSNIASDESPNLFIGDKYGISNITFQGGCPSDKRSIAFDHLGRPHVNITSGGNLYATYMTSDCQLTFSFSDTDIDDLIIVIEKQTGHIYIQDQSNS